MHFIGFGVGGGKGEGGWTSLLLCCVYCVPLAVTVHSDSSLTDRRFL